MIKIGIIDDEKDYYRDYNLMLKRDDIELLLVEHCTTKEEVTKWIIDNKIGCMLVDYKLSNMYTFNGTELVTYINSTLPDVQCVIVTSYCETGIADNLVIENAFISREYFHQDRESEQFQKIIALLRQANKVYENRIEMRVEEFGLLKAKRDSDQLTIEGEERFLSLYKLLKNYNEIDDIPVELLTGQVSSKLDSIIETMNNLIDARK